jgi:hypothetical protein
MALGEFGSLKHIADKNRKITDIFIYKIKMLRQLILKPLKPLK